MFECLLFLCFVFFLSLARLYFLSHCLPALCPTHQLPCGRNRRGIKPLHSRTMRSIAPWRYTTLSHKEEDDSHEVGSHQRVYGGPRCHTLEEMAEVWTSWSAINRHSEHAVTWAHAKANITMSSSLGLHLDYKNHSEWKLNRIRHVKHHVSPQRSRNQLTEGSIRMRCHRDPMTPESTSSHSRRISQGSSSFSFSTASFDISPGTTIPHSHRSAFSFATGNTFVPKSALFAFEAIDLICSPLSRTTSCIHSVFRVL